MRVQHHRHEHHHEQVGARPPRSAVRLQVAPHQRPRRRPPDAAARRTGWGITKNSSGNTATSAVPISIAITPSNGITPTSAHRRRRHDAHRAMQRLVQSGRRAPGLAGTIIEVDAHGGQ